MATFSSRQWVAILSAVVLLALLFFINQKPPLAAQTPPMANNGGHVNNNQPSGESFDHILDEAKKDVPATDEDSIDKMDASVANAGNDEKLKVFKAIVDRYDSMGALIPGTYYVEKLATLRNSADLWYKAADRYYSASEVSNDNARVTLIQKASECYTNSFKIDSTNLDTRVGMGKCLVEMSGAPMQGIAIIEGVLKKDSNNLNGQLALGQLSVQSGQFPKALYRFGRVLQIKPTYNDAYLYLADVYEKMGNKAEAVKSLEKYSTFVADKKIKGEVEEEIKRLQSSTITNQ